MNRQKTDDPKNETRCTPRASDNLFNLAVNNINKHLKQCLNVGTHSVSEIRPGRRPCADRKWPARCPGAEPLPGHCRCKPEARTRGSAALPLPVLRKKCSPTAGWASPSPAPEAPAAVP